MSLIARPYQQKALDEIRALFRQGNKHVLLQMPTGSGKTFIFSTILQGASAKGTRCVMVVRGKSLVDQASQRLTAMGVSHGVEMGNDNRKDEAQLIQVVSIDTCHRRKYYPPADLVVLDEAHFAGSPSFKEFLAHYTNSYWLSVTATPWTETGLEHLAKDEHVIYPISIQELITQKYLCGPKYFIPSSFDSQKIKMKSGEFDEQQAIDAFNDQKIMGDVIKNYEKYCLGECTFVFAINVEHAKSIVQDFNNHGHKAVLVTADVSLEERKKILDNENLIVSVGTMTTGVDVPRLRNIIVCRPTKSKNLHIQMLGRGTRTYENKEFFRVLDHVSNIDEHGFIEDEKKASLKPKVKKSNKKKNEEKSVKFRVCHFCFAVNDLTAKKCKECDCVLVATKQIEYGYGNLDEIDSTPEGRLQRRCYVMAEKAWRRGYKIGWVYMQLLKEYSPEELRKCYAISKKRYENWEKGLETPPCAKGVHVPYYSGGW